MQRYACWTHGWTWLQHGSWPNLLAVREWTFAELNIPNLVELVKIHLNAPFASNSIGRYSDYIVRSVSLTVYGDGTGWWFLNRTRLPGKTSYKKRLDKTIVKYFKNRKFFWLKTYVMGLRSQEDHSGKQWKAGLAGFMLFRPYVTRSITQNNVKIKNNAKKKTKQNKTKKKTVNTYERNSIPTQSVTIKLIDNINQLPHSKHLDRKILPTRESNPRPSTC